MIGSERTDEVMDLKNKNGVIWKEVKESTKQLEEPCLMAKKHTKNQNGSKFLISAGYQNYTIEAGTEEDSFQWLEIDEGGSRYKTMTES